MLVNRLISTLLFLLLLAVSAQCVFAEQASVQGTRVWTDPEKTRLVFETSSAITHRIFPLDEPDRLVIDLDDARMQSNLPKVDLGDPVLVGLRGGVRGGSDLRIVLDLKQPVRAKSFALSPNERYGHRLIIDLTPKDGSSVRRVALPSFPNSSVRKSGAPRGEGPAIIVAIDAGHGGEDPGAIGAAGTLEKDVTLAIARELAKLVDREPGLEALMIRDGDYYIGLQERIGIARERRADLFVSIHADAFTNATARGSSVYTLSFSGASSEAAKWLANRENSADLIGGVDLANNDDLLATVLMDMTQNATIEQSTQAAAMVLANLGRLGVVHRGDVQRAGFAVLKAPDVPSILVETAFISNPEEEKRLRDRGHQRQLAQAIMAGVLGYFRKYPPHGTLVDASLQGGGGAREYVIGPGDTLSGIAKRHSVSISALRARNGLNDDIIRVGQVLAIPEDS
ncbi:N-acetylmuramoyl-L-alanine amidase [Thiocapsa bogorovii]|uniref:N-acetylmuramoyl-L-alanine amidase n=1 Tax=Thiocapsa bogorovii TaxID=521689 RepID=UPI001E5FDD81|nr:N-acetylmuramoyl-L-alanine amidase [Thiocapsa bogorovii]UHD16190.1 N-acetylmuramoyl-L-alanine amidase [Thiocapsa bogorovii]